MTTTADACSKLLSHKQKKLEIEIIDIDEELEQLVETSPHAKSIVDKKRDTLGRCVHLINGVNPREFCSDFVAVEVGGLE